MVVRDARDMRRAVVGVEECGTEVSKVVTDAAQPEQRDLVVQWRGDAHPTEQMSNPHWIWMKRDGTAHTLQRKLRRGVWPTLGTNLTRRPGLFRFGRKELPSAEGPYENTVPD